VHAEYLREIASEKVCVPEKERERGYYICIYIYMCVYIYIYDIMYAYTYIYIYTYIHVARWLYIDIEM